VDTYQGVEWMKSYRGRGDSEIVRKVVLVAGLIAALVLAPSASATEPTRSVTLLSGVTFVDFLTCPGFGVSGTFDSRFTLVTYYDADGNVASQTAFVHYTGYLYNTPDPSKRVPGDGNFIVFLDADGNFIAQSGVDRHATVPGVGVVDLDAGRIVFGETLRGMHDESTGVAPAALCAALE
jgi:hypothetical protein